MRARDYGCFVPAIGTAVLLLQPGAASAQDRALGLAGHPREPVASISPAPDTELAEPIIVTARRMEERLQLTPLSVVSLSADDLEQMSATGLVDIQYAVANVTIAPSQNVGDAAGNFFIRGIGQEDFIAGSEPGVGVYLDGVYVARTMGALVELVDIERIEVLRGPQGTLYGRNAVGGSINVISVPPAARTDSYAGLLAGSFGRAEVRGMVNRPVSNNLLVRLTGGWIRRGGYLRRLPPPLTHAPFLETNREKEGAATIAVGRVQIRWLPSPSLTLDLSADFSRRSGTQPATHVDAIKPDSGILPTVNDLISQGRLAGPMITGALVTDDLLSSFAGGGNSIVQDIEGISAIVRHDLDPLSIKLILAYRGLRSHVVTDVDGSWFPILRSDFEERHRQYSAELQAQGTRGPLTYTSGLFFQTERIWSQSVRGAGRLNILYLCGCFYPPEARPELFFPRRRLTGDSLAAYAQTNVELLSGLNATIGARWSSESKSTEAQLLEIDAETVEPTQIVLRSASDSDRWNSLTWRLGLDFRPAPDLMFYVSAAKGYKSGGFNARPVANLANLGINPFAPETALTYEAGVRSEWFAQRLRFNATIFSTDYRDIQVRRQTFSDGILTTLIGNAARARIWGVEAELSAILAPRFRINLSSGYLAPRYLELGSVPGLTLASDFQRSPHLTLAASIDYSMPLRDRSLIFHANYGYRSREQFQLAASPFDQPGHALLDARITLREARERWSIALFGKNLTDERYRMAGRGTGLSEVGIAVSVIGVPRQIGVEFRIGR